MSNIKENISQVILESGHHISYLYVPCILWYLSATTLIYDDVPLHVYSCFGAVLLDLRKTCLTISVEPTEEECNLDNWRAFSVSSEIEMVVLSAARIVRPDHRLGSIKSDFSSRWVLALGLQCMLPQAKLRFI